MRKVWVLGIVVLATVLTASAAGDAPATPSFLAPWTYGPGPDSAGVATGDFNGDGRTDVAWSTGRSSDTRGLDSQDTLFLFTQQPDGSLAAPTRIFTDSGTTGSMALASGDFNGDGRPDLAVAASNGIELLTQTASGFAPPSLVSGTVGATGLRAADLNGDGKADLVVWTDAWTNGAPGGTVTAYLAPSFTPVPIESGTWVNDVAVGDLTADGRPDVVTAHNTGVFLDAQTTTGGFASEQLSTATPGANAVAIGDVTGDGRPDLVTTGDDANRASVTDVYAGQPDGSLGPATTYSDWDGPAHQAIVDLNGDGLNDLVDATAGSSGQGTATNVRMQGSDGTLGPVTHLFEPLSAATLVQVATGDLNGDGKPDIAVADTYSGLVIFRQAGADTTPPTTTITSEPPSQTTSGSATFAFASSEAGSTFQCRLTTGPSDNFGWSACSSPFTVTGLQPGPYAFFVRAVDPAGNTDPNPPLYTWSVEPPSTPPANDNFANATALGGDTGGASGDTTLATREQGEPQILGYAGGHSVWYTFTSDDCNGGTETVDPSGSQIDALLAVYTGTALTSLTPVASAHGPVSFTCLSGTTYRIQLDSTGSGGLYSLGYSWRQASTPPPPPPSAPANDLFANAQALSGTSGSLHASNQNATKETGEPAVAGNAGGASVWYRWTPAATGTASIDTFGSTFDTLLGVYTGSSVSHLTAVATDDDANGTTQSQVSFAAKAGTTYMVVVDGYSGASGSVQLDWNESVAPSAPANDAFANAQVLSGSRGSTTGSNVGATKQAGEPSIAGNRGGASVWYRWQAPSSGSVSVDTFGSSFDTLLGVYTGSSVSSLKAVATNDDANGGVQSRVTFTAKSGTTYMIAVDGYGGATGKVKLDW
ncbi:MAG TPA: VCBS repeat-containing protein [Gaiellaceae bacterium]|nr:VCBS repeat-containing protein [Gaiellaceae bacterium]